MYLNIVKRWEALDDFFNSNYATSLGKECSHEGNNYLHFRKRVCREKKEGGKIFKTTDSFTDLIILTHSHYIIC